jgi:hypothetical protein
VGEYVWWKVGICVVCNGSCKNFVVQRRFAGDEQGAVTFYVQMPPAKLTILCAYFSLEFSS